ncbi:hypothetical protein [Fibrella aquatilis]|uniref:Uncharacterized protein n=1 Tax=Fibrella aquatilis TaxID=2817059 RepID=A0A939K1S4_9BACT|nr:hypothetical protein [Fibrella aquatilis]MBO0932560.1 hypothetical protein [Fibrella aquatilis]
MNRLLFLLLLLLPILSDAQTLKTVKKRSKYLLEQFEVLADNDTMRTGSYKKMFIDTKKLLEEGRYEANRRVGIWTFYSQGTPELVYDYTARNVIDNKRTQTVASLAQIQQGDTVAQVYLDASPVYLASSEQIYAIMAREVRFPAHLQRQGLRELSFKVIASVSLMGTFYRILASNPDTEFKKSARDAMNMAIKGIDWLPVIYQDKPVAATYLFSEIVVTAIPVERRTEVITTEMVGRPH